MIRLFLLSDAAGRQLSGIELDSLGGLEVLNIKDHNYKILMNYRRGQGTERSSF